MISEPPERIDSHDCEPDSRPNVDPTFPTSGLFKLSPVPAQLPDDAILGTDVAPLTVLQTPEIVDKIEGGIIHIEDPQEVRRYT